MGLASAKRRREKAQQVQGDRVQREAPGEQQEQPAGEGEQGAEQGGGADEGLAQSNTAEAQTPREEPRGSTFICHKISRFTLIYDGLCFIFWLLASRSNGPAELSPAASSSSTRWCCLLANKL